MKNRFGFDSEYEDLPYHDIKRRPIITIVFELVLFLIIGISVAVQAYAVFRFALSFASGVAFNHRGGGLDLADAVVLTTIYVVSLFLGSVLCIIKKKWGLLVVQVVLAVLLLVLTLLW